MIPQFLSTYLFPASRLISEGGLATSSSTKDCSPLCDTPESRLTDWLLFFSCPYIECVVWLAPIIQLV